MEPITRTEIYEMAFAITLPLVMLLAIAIGAGVRWLRNTRDSPKP